MMAELRTIADLATILARAYLRLDSRGVPAKSGPKGQKSSDSGQNGLDVPGDLRDESSVVNARRSP